MYWPAVHLRMGVVLRKEQMLIEHKVKLKLRVGGNPPFFLHDTINYHVFVMLLFVRFSIV